MAAPLRQDEEKKLNGSGDYNVGVYGAHGGLNGAQEPNEEAQQRIMESEKFYDPMSESRMTRLGLNWESFKKAPGATHGQVAHGVPPEFVSHQNPLLQQVMVSHRFRSLHKPLVLYSSLTFEQKPRHLQMIAVCCLSSCHKDWS